MRAIIMSFVFLSAVGCGVPQARHRRIVEGSYNLGFKRATEASAAILMSQDLKLGDLQDQVIQLNAMCNGKNAIPEPRACKPKKRKLGKGKLRGAN